MKTNAQAVAEKGIEITAFDKAAFAAIDKARTTTDKAGNTMRQALADLLRSKYGAVMPTFAQFKRDRAALKELATQKGLADDQWVRKPYNLAVHALYGALPESDSASAVAKRALRAAEEAAKAAKGITTVKDGKKVDVPAGKPGAPKGETSERAPSVAETDEQFIARKGVWYIMDLCARILNGDASTAEEAAMLQPLLKKHLKAPKAKAA